MAVEKDLNIKISGCGKTFKHENLEEKKTFLFFNLQTVRLSAVVTDLSLVTGQC